MARASLIRLVLAATLAAGVGGLGGCALYMNYPPLEGDTSINNPNVTPMPEVVGLGLQETIRRYPVSGEYVVNLPRGTTRATAEWVRQGLGDSARLVEPETQGLPVYHITRVWIRGGEARVEVLAPDVEGEQRGVVVELHTTGIGEWRVERFRVLASGAVAEPEMFGWSAKGGSQ